MPVREHLTAQHHHGAVLSIGGTVQGGGGHFAQRHQNDSHAHGSHAAHQTAEPYGAQQTAEKVRPQQHRRRQKQHRRRPDHAEVQDTRRQRQQEKRRTRQTQRRQYVTHGPAHVSSP